MTAVVVDWYMLETTGLESLFLHAKGKTQSLQCDPARSLDEMVLIQRGNLWFTTCSYFTKILRHHVFFRQKKITGGTNFDTVPTLNYAINSVAFLSALAIVQNYQHRATQGRKAETYYIRIR